MSSVPVTSATAPPLRRIMRKAGNRKTTGYNKDTSNPHLHTPSSGRHTYTHTYTYTHESRLCVTLFTLRRSCAKRHVNAVITPKTPYVVDYAGYVNIRVFVCRVCVCKPLLGRILLSMSSKRAEERYFCIWSVSQPALMGIAMSIDYQITRLPDSQTLSPSVSEQDRVNNGQAPRPSQQVFVIRHVWFLRNSSKGCEMLPLTTHITAILMSSVWISAARRTTPSHRIASFLYHVVKMLVTLCIRNHITAILTSLGKEISTLGAIFEIRRTRRVNAQDYIL